MPSILVVSASPSGKSKTAALAQHVADRLTSIGMEARHLRLRDLPPEALVRADSGDAKVAEAAALVKDAHGIVLVTPTYKASYSGLLKVFLEHPNRVLNRDQLLNLTQGRDADPFDRSIDIQISRLRQKLGEDARLPQIIKTVRNGGYVLAGQVSVEPAA